MSCEGIYRINGNSKVMEKIKDEFDRFGVAKLNNCDIFSVGGILKLFLVREYVLFIGVCVCGVSHFALTSLV